MNGHLFSQGMAQEKEIVMSIKHYGTQLITFLGFAFLVVCFGQMTLAIPGANGVESNFAEVALMLSTPFLPRLYLAFLLSLFTYFNAYPEASHFPEVINHIISFPLLWMAYKWSKNIEKTPSVILYWISAVFIYYFVGLIPIIFVSQFILGHIGGHEAIHKAWDVAKFAIYEYLVTTFISVFYFLMIRELRTRKSAQEALEKRNHEISRQKSLLQAQFDATQEGILVVSSRGRIVSWNHRFVEIWQIPDGQMDEMGRAIPPTAFANPPTDLDSSVDHSDSSLAEVVDSQQDNLKLDDGRCIDRFTTSIHGENGEHFGRVWFFRDITQLTRAEAERARLQQQFHQSQKMEAVGQLAGGIAHDFNNSLGAIIGAADLAMTEDVTPEERSEYIQMITGAAKRASELTRKLLTFSRKGTKEMGTLDLVSVLNDTLGLLRRTVDKHIAINLENRASHTLVVGDESLLQNAFMNLGINASHAMPDGGSLTIALENIELSEEYCTASPFELSPGAYLAISVRDTGTGMPPEVMSRIFEPFFTTKKEGEGTGLGLAAVYGSIQDHHGAITVYSEIGAGTIFHIFLPLSDESLPEPAAVDAPIEPGTGTILLVDDEDSIRATTKAMLTKIGYTVDTAMNGREGFETFLISPGRFDLVILDMIMPLMGGREVISKIRGIDHSIPILLTSGFPKENDLDALKPLGISGFLQKPYSRKALIEAVTKALRAD